MWIPQKDRGQACLNVLYCINAGLTLILQDSTGRLATVQIPDGAYVLRAEEWPGVIGTADSLKQLLPNILAAVGKRIAR